MRGQRRYELTRAKYLSDGEQQALNQLLERFKESDFRNTTLIWVALYTGARASEVLNIGPEDLIPEDLAVHIKGLKDSDDREIPLPAWLYERLAFLCREGRPFPITYNRFGQIWDQYRPVKKKLHSLRHTFAINLYRRTKDIRLLQVALGHRSWNNTMIYAAYQYKTAELRKGIVGEE